MNVPLWQFAFLFFAGLLAGWVDSIAGGGGVISLPAMFAVGLSPWGALATNKVAASCGSSTATLRYMRAGSVLPIAWPMAGVAFIAAALGAECALHMSAGSLTGIVAVALIIVAIISAFRKDFGTIHVEWPHRKRWYYAIALPAAVLIGFYDGLVGPGTGTFLAFVFVAGLGMDFRRATGSTKLVNFATNIASAIVFMCYGYVQWTFAAIMGAGILIGAYIGSGMAVRVGPRLIRPIFIVMALAVAAKVAWTLTHPAAPAIPK